MTFAKEPDKDELPPPPPYEEVCTMPGHQSLSPPQLYGDGFRHPAREPRILSCHSKLQKSGDGGYTLQDSFSDLNSFASPSDTIITPHTYPPPASFMHGSFPSPQSDMHGYDSRGQGSQLHGYTQHDLQVLSRMSNRPVTLMAARVPMDGQRRKIYIKIFTMIAMIIIVIFVVAITQWFH